MATLDSLKLELRQKAHSLASSLKQPLSDIEHSIGFDILVQGPGWMAYQKFIIPQLSQLLATLLRSRVQISVLEIGSGPKSALVYLPEQQRQKIVSYTAFEPNGLFATRLEEWLCSPTKTESPLPCLQSAPKIHRNSFNLEKHEGADAGDDDKKYDIILFCHSMYDMRPKYSFIERSLNMLVDGPQGGMVVIFHRESLHLNGLVCHQTAFYPTGIICVEDEDEELDCFASIVAGFVSKDQAIQIEWRKVCRALGRREETDPGHLFFSSPEIMAVFTRHASKLSELTEQVPWAHGSKMVKNREARIHRPASIIKPTEVQHVQQCVLWALKYRLGLTVIGGGHSGHCILPNVVSVDMSAFDQVHVLKDDEEGNSDSKSGCLVVAESGCKTADIIRKTMAAGVTVPLGSRPSVGAGLWLQGGIGHLARSHGLACDAIIGAVVVSVGSGEVFYVGRVPSQHRPAGAVRPGFELDLLWALKGAGTNFGIVISVTFRACTAPTYLVRNWVIPLSSNLEAQKKLNEFDDLVAGKLPSNCSADAYLYWNEGQLHLGMTLFESRTTRLGSETPAPISVGGFWGPEPDVNVVDGVDLFDTEMYMSGMHGGHGAGKTSSFKRCLFLKNVGGAAIAEHLVAAVATRPSPLSYLHLLQGGGAVSNVAADATAFGCRDWDFACVVTGVWLREQDGTMFARSVVRWVYDVADDLLSLSSGAYGADLGPDPRDAALADRAFGSNLPRLARLKHSLDPYNTLAYTCPLPKTPTKPNLIILVTGASCSGKDYCADIWASDFTGRNFTARAASISDATKREYAVFSGADLDCLLRDRAYKEHHRSALTAFFLKQVRERPTLLEDHFLDVVHGAVDVNVLLITGMREEAPVATLSHLVPGSKLLEVHIQANKQLRRIRGGGCDQDDQDDRSLNYQPCLTFENDRTGDEAVRRFAEHNLLPLLHNDLQQLSDLVRSVHDFPRPGIEFQHVLGISQQPGGLALCTSLLQSRFAGDWAQVDAVVCCEAGGFVYASALASRVSLPLVLIREAGKLPPPVITARKSSSHISFSKCSDLEQKEVEMERDVIPRGASVVVVVDDVLSTGRTLCAVLQLLGKAGVDSDSIGILTVAEFPVHRGRALLRQKGFGKSRIQSLLVFGGA